MYLMCWSSYWIIFFSIFIMVFSDNFYLYIIEHWIILPRMNTKKRYVTRGEEATCHKSTLRNEKWFLREHLSHFHNHSHSQNVLGTEHCTFRNHCSVHPGCSHRSRSMERVVSKVVEQEKERRSHPDLGRRRWASPASPLTWLGVALR